MFPRVRGLQRDVVYIGWPIAPSYMSPKAGEGGELWGLSEWVQLYTGAQINFGDLTPYLTFAQSGWDVTCWLELSRPDHRRNSVAGLNLIIPATLACQVPPKIQTNFLFIRSTERPSAKEPTSCLRFSGVFGRLLYKGPNLILTWGLSRSQVRARIQQS